ncbi:XRE family transcriptional regulator [Sporosarcina sp. BI001-red]|uniref:helix-turn-helix domain-containing protein n=1 Tax=Sporosarcina sp. BI001-red TaxID=2282866 RepID=UPI000E264B92|nr:helix-turn-helix transcriptional regulator [Sporosarcina sp. BI001-red]REB10033.1 XRE family transcriptional regulator [Sporosarcina sp. BI001-red]
MNEIENITVGAVLKRLRKSLKLSQEELAHRSSLDRTYISMMERNIKQPTITTIFLLSDGLEIKPSEFVQLLENEFKEYNIKRTTV